MNTVSGRRGGRRTGKGVLKGCVRGVWVVTCNQRIYSVV